MQIASGKLVSKDRENFILEVDDQQVFVPRKVRLTKARIDELPFNLNGQRLHFDVDLPGFGLVVGARSKTYIAQADVAGRARRITIGKTNKLTPDEARKEAKTFLAMMGRGEDPVKQEEFKKQAKDAAGLTLAKAYKEFKATGRHKASTLYDYDCLMNRLFSDWLDRPVIEITKSGIMDLHARNKARSGHSYADYGMRVLSAILTYVAARYETPDGRSLLPENPVRVLSQTKSWERPKRRTNIIKDADLPFFFMAIESLRQNSPNDQLIQIGTAYLEFVLFTGLRRNEAARMRWRDVDFKGKTITILETKNDDPHVLPLSDHLIALLKARQKHGNGNKSKKEATTDSETDWVFPSPRKPAQPLAEPRYVADRVISRMKRLKKSELERALKPSEEVKFSIHDLRRTFATAAEKLDLSYYALKKLLNHRMAGDVTSGYQVITATRLEEPMQRITNHFLRFRILD